MPRPGLLAGALVGALLSAALIAILYLSSHLAGLPFIPFDVFDWTGRVLPGAVITFGIDAMVTVIRALDIGPTSEVAKLAEQTMAIAGLAVTGVVAGIVLFAVMRKRDAARAISAGLVLGAIIGVPVALIVLTRGQPVAAGRVVAALWTVVAFLGFGAALGWVYRRLATVAAAEPGAAGVEAIDRRRFMIRLGGATAVITVAGATLGKLLAGGRAAGVAPAEERWSAMNPLPNAGAQVEPAEGTRPEFTPLDEHYRIDINATPPVVDGEQWRLRISGLVDRPAELTLADLRERYEPTHQLITLACISNRIAGDLTSTTRWTGVSLGRLLQDVGLRPEATHLRIRSVDGFDEVVALDVVRADPRLMLTYAWDGVPLPQQHGFPLRIYIPDRYGMKQPKWIESIEAIDQWEPGYWVRRGWDRDALMRATSVIDTIAVDMMIIQADPQSMTVPIGGIAHAGARGISRVEVRMDDGPWQPALLREPLSDTTWVIWRYDWPFQPGNHTFTVRCFERDGTPQIETPSSVRPSGATGLHSLGEVF